MEAGKLPCFENRKSSMTDKRNQRCSLWYSLKTNFISDSYYHRVWRRWSETFQTCCLGGKKKWGKENERVFEKIRLRLLFSRNTIPAQIEGKIFTYIWVQFLYSISSWLRRTHRATFRLNSAKFSRHSLAASTFAGLWSFGSASIEITEIIMVSTVWIGSHLSHAFS